MRNRHVAGRASAARAVVSLAIVLGAGSAVGAQTLRDVHTPETPLVLKAQGSFFVGGDKVEETSVMLGGLGPGGHIAVNQMYVRFMVPEGGEGNVPVVMVHGATLTGKSWETTPDGRMGWDEYFVRRGHPVYVPDQVGRGRSGFNQAVFNDVRAGTVPPANLPLWLRFSDEGVWPNFRFGSEPGKPYAGGQFPVTAVDELAKQAVPDVTFGGGVPTPNPTLKALSDLAMQLRGAVVMGHSQSGSFPLAAALLNPGAMKGLVLVEPGSCPATYTAEQISTLAKIPLLVVFGDNRDTPTGIAALPNWQARFEACQALIGRIKGAGGQAEMLDPTDRGMRGNSHMIMQDRNNLQIADFILQWIDARVSMRAAVQAQGRTEVTINDTGTQAENLTSSQDGTVYFGSTAKGTIYRAAPGAAQAEPWILAATAGLTNVLGVLADDKTNTLWVCQNSTGGRGGAPVVGQTALRSFDLRTGAAKGHLQLPIQRRRVQRHGRGPQRHGLRHRIVRQPHPSAPARRDRTRPLGAGHPAARGRGRRGPARRRSGLREHVLRRSDFQDSRERRRQRGHDGADRDVATAQPARWDALGGPADHDPG